MSKHKATVVPPTRETSAHRAKRESDVSARADKRKRDSPWKNFGPDIRPPDDGVPDTVVSQSLVYCVDRLVATNASLAASIRSVVDQLMGSSANIGRV